MRIHFIAIGGAVMHNLAIALKNKGYDISGSDDVIFDPSKTNLEQNGLLPEKFGFYKKNITKDLDAAIVGMHARPDNKELEKAQELGIRIYSFPEYIYEFARNKKRVVIAGSHGKTTITSMIMHVLKHWNCEFDYMVGAKVQGFEQSVKLSEEAPVIILEGDEYLSSPIHREPKFLAYKPHVALISGIAWDHVNVYPDYKDYVNQFKLFAESIRDAGTLVYNTEDTEVRRIAQSKVVPTVNKFPYHTPGYIIENHKTYINKDQKRFPVQIIGEHNLQNMQGARIVCNSLGISDDDFYKAIADFTGAAFRLELLNQNNITAVYRDFAHSPSKLKATVQAVKQQYSERKLVACMELHTFSSLNKKFLSEYKGCMNDADIPIVYYNKETLEHKKLPNLSPKAVKEAFANDDLEVFTDRDKMLDYLMSMEWRDQNLLLMTSGNFDGIVFKEVADKVIYHSLLPKE